jgi:uncharacterized protein (UPF0303 family)
MTRPTVTLAELLAEQAELIFPRFAEAEAWALGCAIVALASANALPVVINIRTPDRTLFHAAMSGSAPLNDLWARRKSNTALMFQEPSMLVTTRLRDKGDGLAKHGLTETDYAASGGAVPIVVAGVGVVAVATVSGLPELHDHQLVVQAIRAMLAR